MNLKSSIIKILFSLSSFSWFILFIAIIQNRDIPYIKMPKFLLSIWFDHILMIKAIIYLIIIIWFTYLLVFFLKKTTKSEDNISDIIKISPLEWDLFPVYLWLFLISLSFWNNCATYQQIITLILFIFRVSFETISYFNPFMYFIGYRFYKVETKSGIIVTIISKIKDVKMVDNVNFRRLKRLNNFTFLDLWDEKNFS